MIFRQKNAVTAAGKPGLTRGRGITLRLPEITRDDAVQRRGEAFGIGERQMRPFGQIPVLVQLRMILEVDTRSAGLREQYIPGFGTREDLVFVLEISAVARRTHE